MEEYLALFAKYDDPVGTEHPVGFDRVNAIARFNEFAGELSHRAHAEYVTETGFYIQDASFHSEIHLPGGRLLFSCFGEMIAFSIDHEIPSQLVELVRDLAREHGYILVPTGILETPCTSANPALRGLCTWWERFFDYL
ncbi:MAG: hypothetical protein ABIQ57_16445 [Candidatus Kapaibacterium sp.]